MGNRVLAVRTTGGRAHISPAVFKSRQGGQEELTSNRIIDLLQSRKSAERMQGLDTIVKNKGALQFLAINSEYADVRLGAVERLKESFENLKTVIGQSKFKDAKAAAFKAIRTSTEVLVEIGENYQDTEKRVAANLLARQCSQLIEQRNVAALEVIATYARNKKARLDAVSALDKIANEPDGDDMVPYAAVEALRNIASNSKYKDTRMAVIAKLSKHSDDKNFQELLGMARLGVEKALEYFESKLSEINNEAALEVVARLSKHKPLKVTAADRLVDLGVDRLKHGLEAVAKYASSDRARTVAVEKLSRNAHNLASIAKESLYADTRNHARELLKTETPFRTELRYRLERSG